MTAADVFTLGSPDGLQIQVSNYGARWLSCQVPLADGSLREAILGHATLDDHAREPGFFGAVVGRFANRMGGSRFTLDGHTHTVQPNEGANQLHGGPDGFDRRVWQVRALGPLHLRLALHSPAGDQGYPGAVDAEVTYRLDPARHQLHLHFTAHSDAPCPVNLTSHPYFNLDGGTAPVLGHRLQVAAAHYLPVRPDMIPTGELAAVGGTPFDLRAPRPVGEGLGQGEQQRHGQGYDHCFALDAEAATGDVPAATLTASDGRLALRLFTNYPGLQVCSGNFVHQSRGRDGLPFARHAGIALEPQFFPDAPNHPQWQHQGCIVRPGQPLSRWMRLDFLPD
ncbi:aldose epimerase family protein [Roseateles sp. BYS87W]|uniref:Aldose 1-epimerase n=1 Tax=Pelomonas baiyunensis TaxID=3299026 RepID=A0ABW7GSV6_9BURK